MYSRKNLSYIVSINEKNLKLKKNHIYYRYKTLE